MLHTITKSSAYRTGVPRSAHCFVHRSCESAYEPDLPGVMTELRAKGLVVESDGAQVVVLDDERTPIFAMLFGSAAMATLFCAILVIRNRRGGQGI